jgi:predicted amidohydrolase
LLRPAIPRALSTARAGGARIITAPSAFTFETGKDHWDLLVRTRALENQVFVLAAAQFGSHPPGPGVLRQRDDRRSMGRRCWPARPEGEGVVVAELDFGHQDKIRKSLPALSHRRTEVLGL